MADKLCVSVLSGEFEKQSFHCGEPSLDNYLQRTAGQDSRRQLSVCYVLHRQTSAEVMGFYTLSSFAIMAEELPEPYRRKLPYPRIPATLLGRLAVDLTHQGKKLGEFLLMDALQRSLASAAEIGSHGVVVDCLHEKAAQFYAGYEFEPLQSGSHQRLLLPMKKVADLFSN